MSTYIQQAERTVYTQGTRGKIYDVNGKVLAYDELAYTVRMEDKLDSSNEKNQLMNDIVYKAINVIEKYGDKVIVDFPIILDQDGKWKENFSSDAAKKLFLKNIFGEKMKYKDRDFSNASAGELISHLKNVFFEVKLDVDDEMLLKILSIRYNVFANSYQKYVGVTIAKDINEKTVAAIYENEADLTGVMVEEKTVRKYNDSEYFAPILGYTGTISDTQIEEYDKKGKTYTSSDIVGKAGIESSFEKYLQGKHGEEKIFVDNTGKKLSTISKKDSKAGKYL